jgi:hypothetical protein
MPGSAKGVMFITIEDEGHRQSRHLAKTLRKAAPHHPLREHVGR